MGTTTCDKLKLIISSFTDFANLPFKSEN